MRSRTASIEICERHSPVAYADTMENTQVDAWPLTRWEFLSLIVWDDDSKSAVTSDIEDVEVLNILGSEGWDLVSVVPLARTQVLEMAYPGNTRKLLAYLKRPIL